MNKDFGFVMATEMLIKEKRPVKFMYRETPDQPGDSGWRFFCGEEDDEYLSCPEHIGIYDIKTVLSCSSDILDLLSSEIGACYGRDNGSFIDCREALVNG